MTIHSVVNMRTSFYLISIAIYVLNIVDLVTTSLALERGGSELNPIFRHFNTIGITGVDVIVKTTLPLLSLLFMFYYYKIKPKKTLLSVCFIFSFYFFVVLHNISLLT